MKFTAAARAGENRPKSLPSERLKAMATTMIRPRLLEAGLISALEFTAGFEAAMSGRKLQLTEAEVLDRTRHTEVMSRMLGYKAGELERRGGGGAAGLAGGREGEGAASDVAREQAFFKLRGEN